jgi:hypothetical protein
MTQSTSQDVVRTVDDIADLKNSSADDTHGLTWHANLWANVPTAIQYANNDPLSQPGTIVFNIRDNGQVWTYDFH